MVKKTKACCDMTKPYRQNISDFSHITAQYDVEVERAFAILQAQDAQGAFPFLDAVYDTKPLEQAMDFVEKFSGGIKNIVILGTGGSGLGARAIASWMGYFTEAPMEENSPHFYIADNFDPITFTQLLERLVLQETYFIIISKSGGTLEILSQAFLVIEKFSQSGLRDFCSKHICVVTEEKDSVLFRLAQKYALPLLPHNMEIGGRYSVLTMTGLLPALFLKCDVKALLEGAKSVVADFRNAKIYTDSAPVMGAACLIGAEKYASVTTHIAMGYGDRFTYFNMWMRQLWAESLGKQGKGALFVPAIAPLDHHSQLQLYADGPDDKDYSIFKVTSPSDGLVISDVHDKELEYLQNYTMGHILQAIQNGTIQSLRNKARLIREIEIEKFDFYTLGALMMHAMIEVTMAACLLGVNAFDQPAVEDSKILVRQILKNK